MPGGTPQVPGWSVPWIVIAVESLIGAVLVKDLPIWKAAMVIAVLIMIFAAYVLYVERYHRDRTRR